MSDNAKKRKRPPEDASAAKRSRFNIPAARSATAYPSGEVNVARFMRAHENEIKSLENSMRLAKKGLSGRAFQDVPRDLRRRTGSHNPQRVPKRLRQQARREAEEDNTPIKKGKSGSGIGKKGTKMWLRHESIKKKKKAKEKRQKAREKNKVTATPEIAAQITEHAQRSEAQVPKKMNQRPKDLTTLAARDGPRSRFRTRQIHKTWLPTHLFHTKRARITPPKEPLWRFAIPLSPANKVYRATHRSSSQRGAIAWDMSYMSTIGLEGVEASVSGLLRALNFAEEQGSSCWSNKGMGKKWQNGTRTWEGWIYEREGRPLALIGPATVIWSVQEPGSTKREAFVRIHPSGFLRLWNEVVRAAKVQKPAVAVEDLRFEVGSIEIMGPAATEVLSSILKPTSATNCPPESPESVWPKLASVTDVRSLPVNSLFAFPVSDPRLCYPPKSAAPAVTEESQSELLETLASWPIDNTQNAAEIFSRKDRLAACRSLPSQQSINRRTGAAPVGQYPETRTTDPRIPILVFNSIKSNSWTVLLPWKCVAPIWRCIMHYPLFTGGNPRFGGLKERKQVDFERSHPSFPFDHPGTDGGWEWEMMERSARKIEWTKRPKGKRIEWTSIDLGSGRKGELGDPWACDWERLLLKGSEENTQPSDASSKTKAPFRQLDSEQASKVVASWHPSVEQLSTPHVFTVKISMVSRGVPTACARVYRLPCSNVELRTKWLSLTRGPKPASSARRHEGGSTWKHTPRRVAARLLDPVTGDGGRIKPGSEEYPEVPGEEDLIGFVTTGNFNLAEGRPTAVANLVLQRVLRHDQRPQHDDDAAAALGTLDTMSEDTAAGEHVEGVRTAVKLGQGQLADLTKDILEDVVSNIIFSTALSCHRSEKLLRMQSAATQAESIALSNLEPSSQAKGSSTQSGPPTAETDAAKYENGRVYLKGNPLKTTPDITCPHCKLPRLMHPIMGKGMQNPDLSKEYCMLYPWVQRQGHDVYGNPFPTDTAKTKKERELLKKAEKDSVGTPGSQDTDIAADNPSQSGGFNKLNTGGKPASYIPWHTCPNCKRSLLITRFAQHLEKCLGISGRQSSRNAMAKLAGQNGNGTASGTPLGSRMGTPAPASQGDPVAKVKGKGQSPIKKGGDDEDGDDNETPEKKKKPKKSSYVKKADREKKEGGAPVKLKLKANNPAKDLERKASTYSESSDRPDKRDREETEDGAPKAKKIKLSLVKGEGGSAPPTTEPPSAQTEP
ncbi:ribonuclease P complex subunit Pop1 [Polyplosphaeria fusca]|uniref:SAGA-associated factor 11 n=1 Tax=Polyplosphaeria fusca TaxID=682080 RepID=A0A9P4RCS6_9PLEO|nr:ribonuclease P complex subunit Pop1 [Polyplosphaeria fusca]